MKTYFIKKEMFLLAKKHLLKKEPFLVNIHTKKEINLALKIGVDAYFEKIDKKSFL